MLFKKYVWPLSEGHFQDHDNGSVTYTYYAQLEETFTVLSSDTLFHPAFPFSISAHPVSLISMYSRLAYLIFESLRPP